MTYMKKGDSWSTYTEKRENDENLNGNAGHGWEETYKIYGCDLNYGSTSLVIKIEYIDPNTGKKIIDSYKEDY